MRIHLQKQRENLAAALYLSCHSDYTGTLATKAGCAEVDMREYGESKPKSEAIAPATVIVLVYNTPDLLVQCLQSFYETCLTRRWQIIVVDNGSDEGVRLLVEKKFSGIDVIRSERNLGFAAGNNLGLRAANGEFVILMNSDIVADAETLESLAGALQKQPQAAAMSPGLLTAQGKPQAFSFGTEPSPGYLIRRGIRALSGLGPLHDWEIGEALEVGWVSAACLCVRRKVIEEIGAFDERFSLYFEDADWCTRMRAAGWKVIYNPRLHVTHLGSGSRPRGIDRSELYYRSLLLFSEKHYGCGWKFQLRIFISIYKMMATIRSLVLGSFRKKTT